MNRLPTSALRAPRSGDWWPGGMGHPNREGSQHGVRFAYFARARRLAIDTGDEVVLYDTLDHQITGVAPAHGGGRSLRFTSLSGLVELAPLPDA